VGPHEISRGAINLLAKLLSMQAWYSDTRTALIAGRILVDHIDKLEGIKDKLVENEDGCIDTKDAAEYFSKMFELELNEAQETVCRQCVTHFVNKGALNINVHLVGLMDFLAIIP
jgi:hypothetical protein